MTDIEKKALALIDEARREHDMGPIPDYLCARAALIRAIEQHEAYRQEVSDAVEGFNERWGSKPMRKQDWENLTRFIIPKCDPLVEALAEAGYGSSEEAVYDLRAALAARGLEIREKQP